MRREASRRFPRRDWRRSGSTRGGAWGEDRARHRGRCRLPVRGRDERDALGKRGREGVERPAIELPDELARERRATAASGGAREPPDEPGGGGLEREPCSHPSARLAEASRSTDLAIDRKCSSMLACLVPADATRLSRESTSGRSRSSVRAYAGATRTTRSSPSCGPRLHALGGRRPCASSQPIPTRASIRRP